MWNHLLRYNGLGYDGPRYENWNVDAGGRAHARGRRRRVLGVADLRPEEDRSDIGKRSVLVQQAVLRRAGAPQWRGVADHRLGQSAEATAPRLALPAGAAPHEARAGSRLRHAESRRRGCRDLRRRVGLQRRAGPLRLEARRQEGDVRPVQQLSADLPQDRGRHHQAEPPQSRPGPLGAAPRVGRRRRR